MPVHVNVKLFIWLIANFFITVGTALHLNTFNEMGISKQSISMWALNIDYIKHIISSRLQVAEGSSLRKSVNMNIILLCSSLVEGFLTHYVEQEIIKLYITADYKQDFILKRLMKQYLDEQWKGEAIKNAIKKINILTGHDLNNDVTNPHVAAIYSISSIRNIIAHGGTVSLTENEKKKNLYTFNNGRISEVLIQSGIVSRALANNITESDLETVMEALFSDKLADYFSENSFAFIKLVDHLQGQSDN